MIGWLVQGVATALVYVNLTCAAHVVMFKVRAHGFMKSQYNPFVYSLMIDTINMIEYTNGSLDKKEITERIDSVAFNLRPTRDYDSHTVARQKGTRTLRRLLTYMAALNAIALVVLVSTGFFFGTPPSGVARIALQALATALCLVAIDVLFFLVVTSRYVHIDTLSVKQGRRLKTA